MGYPIQQSQTAQPLLFLMVLTSDHITGATGKSPTVTISKNGAAFAAPAGAVSEIGNGWYQVAGNATDSGTLGPLALHATAALSDATDELYPVVSYNPQDATALGLSRIDAAITSRLAPTTVGRTLDVAATGEAGLDFNNINDAAAGHTLTNITVPTATAVTNDVGITQAGADKAWATTTRALTDKAGFSLAVAYDPAKTAAQAGDAMALTSGERTTLAAAIWNALTSGLTTVASIGKLLVDNINATISSRMASGNVTVGAYAAGQDPATLLLVTPANKLDTDATGRVNLGKWLGSVPAALSAAGAYVQTVLQRWLTDDAAGTPRALYAGPLGGLVAARPYMLITNQTAAAGGASTITFSAGSSVDDVYTGCVINLLSGASSGQQRLIVGYVGATKVATVSPAWIAAPDATTVFEVVAASEVDIGLWKRAVPNSLITGRPDVSVGSYPGNTPQTGDNYARLGAPTVSVSADIAAVNAKTTNLPASPAAVGSAMALTTGERDSVADALLDRTGAVEVGLTPRQAMRLMAAALAGKVSGAGTTTIVIRSAVSDTKPRITAVVDAQGDRTSITYDTS